MIGVLLFLVLALESENADLATQAYEDGRFSDAERLFHLALAEDDAARGNLLYALGNCAARQARPAEALLFYRRAERHLGLDAPLQDNQRLCRERLGLEPLHENHWPARIKRAFDRLPSRPTLLGLALLQALCVLTMFRSRGVTRLAGGLLLIATWFTALQLARNHWGTPPDEAVVLAPTLEVREEPHDSMAIGFELRAGELIEILEESDRWLEVEHPAGHGWALADSVGRVED